MDHIRDADQIRERIPDGPGVQWPAAVHVAMAKRPAELFRAKGRGVRVPLLRRQLVRER